jgi:hypothetical protein
MFINELDQLNTEPFRVALGVYDPHLNTSDARIEYGHPVKMRWSYTFTVPHESLIDGAVLEMSEIAEGTAWYANYVGEIDGAFAIAFTSELQPTQEAVNRLAGKILEYVAEAAA